jgi:hypothetical protein
VPPDQYYGTVDDREGSLDDGEGSNIEQKGILTDGTDLKWMSSSLPASRKDSSGHADRFRNDIQSKMCEPEGLMAYER